MSLYSLQNESVLSPYFKSKTRTQHGLITDSIRIHILLFHSVVRQESCEIFIHPVYPAIKSKKKASGLMDAFLNLY